MPQAGEADIILCPVERLGREYARVSATYDALEDEAHKLKEEFAKPLREETKLLNGVMSALLESAAFHRAQSHAGAIFQVMAAAAEVQALADCAAEEASADVDRSVRSIRRMLYSVIDVLERDSGANREDLGAGVLMPARMDMAARVAERMERS